MKNLRTIGSLLMILVLLYGTTGLTVLHHICHHSHTDRVVLFPGVVENPGPGCCGEDILPVRSADPDGCHESHCAGHLEETPCCKSVFTFFQLDFSTVRVSESFQQELPVTDMPAPLAGMLSEFEGPDPVPVMPEFSAPPPLFGKSLVLRLHQLRIPAPSYLS